MWQLSFRPYAQNSRGLSTSAPLSGSAFPPASAWAELQVRLWPATTGAALFLASEVVLMSKLSRGSLCLVPAEKSLSYVTNLVLLYNNTTNLELGRTIRGRLDLDNARLDEIQEVALATRLLRRA